MRHLLYKLVGKEPVPIDDVRLVIPVSLATTTLEDGVRVSTVFLSIDHSHGLESGKPVLFETMVFGGAMDQAMKRYKTWDDAMDGHNEMVELVRSQKNDEPSDVF